MKRFSIVRVNLQVVVTSKSITKQKIFKGIRLAENRKIDKREYRSINKYLCLEDPERDKIYVDMARSTFSHDCL